MAINNGDETRIHLVVIEGMIVAEDYLELVNDQSGLTTACACQS